MLSESLLPEYDHEMATTRKVLERVPDEHLAWKPHEKSFSMQELATHLASIPGWVGVTVEADGLDLSEPMEQPTAGDRVATLAAFDEGVAAGRAVLASASDEQLMGMWTFRTGDEVHFTAPKVAVVRSFVMNHLIHHRGQLTVYLRQKDVPLPSVYGPSADDASF